MSAAAFFLSSICKDFSKLKRRKGRHFLRAALVLSLLGGNALAESPKVPAAKQEARAAAARPPRDFIEALSAFPRTGSPYGTQITQTFPLEEGHGCALGTSSVGLLMNGNGLTLGEYISPKNQRMDFILIQLRSAESPIGTSLPAVVSGENTQVEFSVRASAQTPNPDPRQRMVSFTANVSNDQFNKLLDILQTYPEVNLKVGPFGERIVPTVGMEEAGPTLQKCRGIQN